MCLCRLCPHSVIHAAVSLHPVFFGVLSLCLCAPTFCSLVLSHPTSCCLLSHRLCCVSCESYSFPSLCFRFSLCLPALSLFFSFFSPLSLSGCMLGSKKRNSLLLSVQRGHIQFLFMKKKLKMSDFSVFFTSHYFQLPMLPAVGQMNNINYQGDIHERIK